MKRSQRLLASITLAAFFTLSAFSGALFAADLELVQHVAADSAFHVNTVLIAGPTEAVLIDTQYHLADARLVAERIAETGKRLKAIFITHPDHDHFAGAAVFAERFPDTPIYMTEAALHHFEAQGIADFWRDKKRQPELFADDVVMPEVLPSTDLTVDGETIEILPDLQGDVLEPLNSVVWIPSSRTLIASDLVFNGVHAWLGASDPQTRAAWRRDLDRLADLEPAVVIAGHKPTVDTVDSAEALQTMIDYLTDFDAAREVSQNGEGLAEIMMRKYPWDVPILLEYSTRMAYPQP